MRRFLLSISLTAFTCLTFLGCGSPSQPAGSGSGGDGHSASDGSTEHAGHQHDDQLFWHRQDLEHAGCHIDLGQHGAHVDGGHELEPAVRILRDDQPFDEAKVFVALLDGDAQQVLVEEVATVYEPPTPSEPAHYAQGKLPVPKAIDKAVLRYRIEWPDAPPFRYDVLVDVEHH